MEGLKEMERLKELQLAREAKERLEVENERLRVECEELKSKLEEMRGILSSGKVEMKEEVKGVEERMVEKMDEKFVVMMNAVQEMMKGFMGEGAGKKRKTQDKDKPEDTNKKGAEEKKKAKGKKVSKGDRHDETRTKYIGERAESELYSHEWKQVGRKKKSKKSVVKSMDVSMEVDLLYSDEGKKGQNGSSESESEQEVRKAVYMREDTDDFYEENAENYHDDDDDDDDMEYGNLSSFNELNLEEEEDQEAEVDEEDEAEDEKLHNSDSDYNDDIPVNYYRRISMQKRPQTYRVRSGGRMVNIPPQRRPRLPPRPSSHITSPRATSQPQSNSFSQNQESTTLGTLDVATPHYYYNISHYSHLFTNVHPFPLSRIPRSNPEG
ncbi:glutamic acid-rich protein-like [Macrobrachium nipponense]|uniref:glutamic acid-rich protein-like n=1 Tax=Macrobrachium nipponense TaxID=159736 RepID=UPI0030C8B585